ncbi:mitochondrial carrier domain-containing protein [Emericellopsis atlantica]|uniref:Mitochondrial carrier domain-containing protein n=1 Tax=Emericellopsis atlantica TaxID=2614577 RepID=A0A9P7ZDR1_9HYPO|nr:mitochondrial carrier domain-containing protein [Emericellopsis atlantica]KAG9249812.1 mitochondrial carrier domain-containing protein [Emericellopsis atlantica]
MAASPPTPLQSILAGGAAGGVESLVTYPTEYIKTRMQLISGGAPSVSPPRLLLQTIRDHGIRTLYTGAGAFCVSNALKSGVRFLTFDIVRGKLPKNPETGKPTTLNTMVSGVMAGVTESLTVVTPGESIKTRIVEERSKGTTSTFAVIRSMAASQGIRGFYRGVLPVTMKQSSNAIVRFTSYHTLFSLLQGALGSFAAPFAGACAGVVTVYATMPFDTIKTKMQGTSGRSGQRTLHYVAQTIKEAGIRGLWKGTTPRLLRLSVSGALSFTIYEYVLDISRKAEVREPNFVIL